MIGERRRVCKTY